MAYISVNPVSGSLITRGAILTVTWSGSELPYIAYRNTAGGPDEVISSPTGPVASIGAGYTGQYGYDGTNSTIAFRRDAGWPSDNFIITMQDEVLDLETQVNFIVLREGEFPPDMQDFYNHAKGNLTITEEGVVVDTKTSHINFDGDTFDVTLNATGSVTVTGLGGAGGSAITVTEEGGAPLTTDVTSFDFVGPGVTASSVGDDVTVTVDASAVVVESPTGNAFTAGVTKFIYEGTGVTVTEPSPDEILVTIDGPVAAGAGDQEVIGTVITNGLDGAVATANSVGIGTCTPNLIPGNLTVNWDVPFADTDYFVQVTMDSASARWATFDSKATGSIDIWFFDDTGTTVNPSVNAISADIYAQSQPVGVASLDALINSQSKDNDVNVPVSNPIILRDAGQFGHTPLTVTKSDGTGPVIEAESYNFDDAGISITNSLDALKWVSFQCNKTQYAPRAGGQALITSYGSLALSGDEDLRLDSLGGNLQIGVAGATPPAEIELVKGMTMGQTAGHPVTPANDKGQWWVRDSDGKPMFTSAANASLPGEDYDLTAGVGGSGDVSGPASSVNNELVAFSGTTGKFIRSAAARAATINPTTGDITSYNDITAGNDFVATNAFVVGTVGITATGFNEPDGGYYFGGANGGASPGENVFTGGTSNSPSVKGGANYVRGGIAIGTTSDGGDLNLYGGVGTGVPGNVRIGGYDATVNTTEIEMMKGFSVRESADHPVTTPTTTPDRGQHWVASSSGHAMFTDKDGTDYDLTLGSVDGENAGSPIVTGPFSTLNFIGSGVSAVDGGGGTMNVTIAGSGAPVDTVFGRDGTVLAVASDYDASQIDNDSTVTGAFVDDALNTLDTNKSAVGHTHTLTNVTDSGTAAAEDIGTTIGDVVGVIDIGGSVAGLPAIDGSLLTGVTGSGDVDGPAGGTTDGAIAVFDDTTGKLIRLGTVTEANVTANNAKISYTDAVAVGANTTHSGSDGSDHSKVTANESAIAALGTASAEDIGIVIGDVVGVIDIGGAVAGLPVLDGSNLTGLSTGSYSDLAGLNTDISPDHIANTWITATDPFATAADGDIWIEIP